jgi:hypothetical protein
VLCVSEQQAVLNFHHIRSSAREVHPRQLADVSEESVLQAYKFAPRSFMFSLNAKINLLMKTLKLLHTAQDANIIAFSGSEAAGSSVAQ